MICISPMQALMVIFSGGCSSVGRVPDCDSGCRGFEPHQPPHYPFQKTFNLIYLNPVETPLSYCVLMVACKMSLRHPCRYGRFSSMVNIFTCSNTSAVASKAPHCLEELVTDGRHLLHSHAQGSRQSVSTNRVGLALHHQQADIDLGPCAQRNGTTVLRGSRGAGLYHLDSYFELCTTSAPH